MTATGIPEGKGRRRRWLIALAAVVGLAAGGGWFWHKEGRAWLYGVEAYVYGFPLLMMDLTKEAGTAVPTAGEFTAPINQFSVMTHYPDMSFRAVPLVIRNFWPKAAALDGTYKTPPTRKMQ